MQRDAQKAIETAVFLNRGEDETFLLFVKKASKAYGKVGLADVQKFVFLLKADMKTEEVRTFVIPHAPKPFDELIKTFEKYEQSFRRFNLAGKKTDRELFKMSKKTEFCEVYPRIPPSRAEVVESKVNYLATRLLELTLLMRKSHAVDVRQQAHIANVYRGSFDQGPTGGSLCPYCHRSRQTGKTVEKRNVSVSYALIEEEKNM